MTREEIYKKALERLAILGNEPCQGNSIGNRIAQDALRKAEALFPNEDAEKLIDELDEVLGGDRS